MPVNIPTPDEILQDKAEEIVIEIVDTLREEYTGEGLVKVCVYGSCVRARWMAEDYLNKRGWATTQEPAVDPEDKECVVFNICAEKDAATVTATPRETGRT